MCILFNSSMTESVVILSVLTRRNRGFGLAEEKENNEQYGMHINSEVAYSLCSLRIVHH
jgi:hypothetical protein